MIATLFRRIVTSGRFQSSLLAPLARAAIRRSAERLGCSAKFLVDSHATARPHYAYCMFNAAVLAKSLGLERISAIEFGVAGGNGLTFMREFAAVISRSLGVSVECYGFDTGEGMPEPQGALDLPYWFQSGQYAMNQGALVPGGLLSHVILGNVRDTVTKFIAERDPAPIGAVFGDLDYWSSTRDSFRLFDDVAARPDSFLPRIFMYFDDIMGSEVEMYGPYNGQLAAIQEFNASHKYAKIHLNQNLLLRNHFRQRFQIYYAHFFGHPSYGRFVGSVGQETIEKLLKLERKTEK